MIPVRLELTTPPLKVECSKPTELRDLLFVILVTFHKTLVFVCLFYLVECVRIERLPNVPNILCNHYTTHSLLFFATGGGIEPPMVFYLQGQNLVTLPNSSTPQFYRGEMRCRPPYLSVPAVFKTESQAVVIIFPFIRPICQRTFFFWGSYQGRTDDSGLQSRDITKLY